MTCTFSAMTAAREPARRVDDVFKAAGGKFALPAADELSIDKSSAIYRYDLMHRIASVLRLGRGGAKIVSRSNIIASYSSS